ncbi:MAG: ADP-ribosylglycohydrolase family protein [Spirochaetota bacterium]
MNEQKIKGMFWGAITGDAIGTPLDGLSKAHLHSVFKNIESYLDPTPALKNKPENWKKPCLYSAISQFMLLLSMFLFSFKRPDPREFTEYISRSLSEGDNELGIFRHPAVMEKYFIKKIKSQAANSGDALFSVPSANLAVLMTPFVLSPPQNETHIEQLLSFSLMLNRDVHSTAGTLIFNALLADILGKESLPERESILASAITSSNSLLKNAEKLMPRIFDLGINPDYLLASIKDYITIFSNIININDIDSSEKTIINYVNLKIKTPVTRATVNHPLAIIPFAAYLSNYYMDDSLNAIFHAAESGGSTSVFCALVGALNGAMYGLDTLPENLINELVNKKKITTMVDSLVKKKMNDELIKDFIHGEASLSAKEIQEKNARLKHVKIKTKKQKSRSEIENRLSSHIVETWTKLDKAKWKRKKDKAQ